MKARLRLKLWRVGNVVTLQVLENESRIEKLKRKGIAFKEEVVLINEEDTSMYQPISSICKNEKSAEEHLRYMVHFLNHVMIKDIRIEDYIGKEVLVADDCNGDYHKAILISIIQDEYCISPFICVTDGDLENYSNDDEYAVYSWENCLPAEKIKVYTYNEETDEYFFDGEVDVEED